MWDLPGPGLEPTSPALAGGFLTTAPPGKSSFLHFKENILFSKVTLKVKGINLENCMKLIVLDGRFGQSDPSDFQSLL